MDHPFVYTAPAARIVFGVGSLQHLEREIELLGAERALILCTPQQRNQAESLARRLGDRSAGIFDRAEMHVPIEVAHSAREKAARRGADCALAIGGGSTIGLGKAIALDSGLPILAVPTTYAGSEVTPIYGITKAGLKQTGRASRVLPRTVIYDPTLTLGLPVGMSLTSGINAIAHAAEGLYAQDANPVMSLMAEEGIRALGHALPAIVKDPADIAARSKALYGAWLCGTVLGNVGMSLHHKLCHTLGGSFNLPHAETHTVMLPHALAYNAAHAPAAMRRIARALDSDDGALAIRNLASKYGAPVSLQELGMQEQDIARAVELTVSNPYWNPRPLERSSLVALMARAFAGDPPITI